MVKPRKPRAPRKPRKAATPVVEERWTLDGRKVVKLERYRSHQKYKLEDGTLVPGASTIAKIGDDASSLIHWAWDLGNKGIDYKKARDQAADIGTIAHFLIECFLHNAEPDLSDYGAGDIEKAGVAYQNFRNWWDAEGLTILEPEVQLVSETYMFGGTIDAPSIDKDGRYVLLDWKTSKAVYDSHRFQLAAYEALWNENRPGQRIQRRGIVRIGKNSPDDFEVAWMFSAAGAFEVFKAQLALYRARNKYKKS
jgi:hypothetical protein